MLKRRAGEIKFINIEGKPKKLIGTHSFSAEGKNYVKIFRHGRIQRRSKQSAQC